MTTAVKLNKTASINPAAETVGTPNPIEPQEPLAHSLPITPQVAIDESFCPREYAWLQLEDRVYKVCKSYFMGPSYFFAQKLSGGPGCPGSSAENPLKLDDVSKSDFVQFMRLAWRKTPGVDEKLNKNELVSALKCASLWNFQGLRSSIIYKLEHGYPGLLPGLHKHGDAEMVHLSQLYQIDTWFKPALSRLAQRPQPLDKEEFEIMGPETALKVMCLRERYTIQCGEHCKLGKPLRLTLPKTQQPQKNNLLPANALATSPPIASSQPQYDFSKDIKELFAN